MCYSIRSVSALYLQFSSFTQLNVVISQSKSYFLMSKIYVITNDWSTLKQSHNIICIEEMTKGDWIHVFLL
jgi:hypothetical protein